MRPGSTGRPEDPGLRAGERGARLDACGRAIGRVVVAAIAGVFSLILVAVSGGNAGQSGVSTIHIGDFPSMEACVAARDGAKSFVPAGLNVQFATVCIPAR